VKKQIRNKIHSLSELMNTISKDVDLKNMRKVYKLVKKRKFSVGILKLLNISLDIVYDYTFESCSFVIALKDMSTIIEVCWYPETIHQWYETQNPLFKTKTGVAKNVK
jgi:hypothetical protein